MEVKVMTNIMDANNKLAQDNRSMFEEKQVTAINVMASPGAGKTSVITSIINLLNVTVPISVIEGDIASSIDAEKIAEMGVPVVQINTGGGCHLDARMIRAAADTLELKPGGLLFIENVGNLVCPSVFDLGEKLRMIIASVPEGHDKPRKYYPMFESAHVVVLNKKDLIPYLDFNTQEFIDGVRAVNRSAPIFEVSCSSMEGLWDLSKWLAEHFTQKREKPSEEFKEVLDVALKADIPDEAL